MALNNLRIDWPGLSNELLGHIRKALGNLASGASEDLELFGREIAQDLVRAMQTGQSSLKDELLVQLRLIAEINRVRLTNEQWATLRAVMDTILRTGSTVLGKVLAVVV